MNRIDIFYEEHVFIFFIKIDLDIFGGRHKWIHFTNENIRVIQLMY